MAAKVLTFAARMKRILITGAGGQVGQKLIGAAKAHPADCRIFAFNRSTLDITSPEDVRAAFNEARPDVVFNAAAYTAVDRAESEPDRAENINVEGAGRLAAACFQRDIQFCHFSTDYVYAEGYDRPLTENDRTVGDSVYARSKLRGEIEVMRRHRDAWIIRTSWVYAEYGENFFRTMLRLGQERPTLSIVDDQVGSPTYAADLAAAAIQLAATPAPGGIYNYSNSGQISWYGFTAAIHRLANIDCKLTPITTKQYPTPAKRPAYSVMDTAKISPYVGKPRHWEAALAECWEKYGRLV